MNRSVIVIATAIVIVVAGSIIAKKFWPGGIPDGPGGISDGPGGETEKEIDNNSSGVSRLNGPPIVQPTGPTQPGTGTVLVSINAIPWARVFIKPPGNDSFMEPRPRDFTIPPEPNEREPNVTPIPGDLRVPVGTAIKLMYRGREKIFRYDQWKDEKTISYDFLNH